jgi:hypothetical protein
MAWIENELKSRPDFDWMIVVGHYPLYSVGENGDQKSMKNALKDLLEQYQVDLYLSGHDHTLQHLIKNDLHYLISGNGAQTGDIDGKTKADSVLFSKADPGFSYHQIFGNTMQVEFIDQNGNVLHSYTQTSKRPKNSVQSQISASLSGMNSSSIISISVGIVIAAVVCVVYKKTRKAQSLKVPNERTRLIQVSIQ